MRKILFSLLAVLFSLTLSAHNPPTGGSESYETPYFDPTHFLGAYQELAQMLEGKQQASFKQAVFLAENAYYGNQLDYQGFEQSIQLLAAMAQQLEANADSSFQYTEKDRAEVLKNYALFSLFSDTIQINHIFQALPPQYNHADPFGTAEWDNALVMNLLASNQGTCRSLSYLYKILADETGAPAYLSLAPNHIYLQHPSRKTNWYNTELTSKQVIEDAWLMAAGYIGLEAIKSRLYMDTLSQQQSVALCLLDLAQGYRHKAQKIQGKLLSSDWAFIRQCAEQVLKHWPNSPNALLLEIETLTAQHQLGTNGAYTQLEATAKKLHALGYRRMPEGMYFETAEAVEKYARDGIGIYYQADQQEGGSATSTKEILTLSNGRYKEFHATAKLERIADLWFDTETLKIHSLIEEDKEKKRTPSLTSRFLSVDPLAPSYPWYTPYQFAGNKPIWAIDLDGLEEHMVNESAKDLYEQYKKVVSKSEILQEIHKSISDPKKAQSIKIHFAKYGGELSKENGFTIKMTEELYKSIEEYNEDMVAQGMLWTENPSRAQFYENISTMLDEAGMTLENFNENKKNEPEYSEYLVAISSDAFNQGLKVNGFNVEAIETLFHEVDLHLKNKINNVNLGGNRGSGDHKEWFSFDENEEHYNSVGWTMEEMLNGRSPRHKDVHRNSRAGVVYSAVQLAVDIFSILKPVQVVDLLKPKAESSPVSLPNKPH